MFMQKPSFIFLMATIFICVSACKNARFSNPKAVSEVFKYTEQANTPCTGKLKHDGEQIAIKGYIQKLNTFPGENRFHMFESADITSSRIEIHVTDNSTEIFKKISDKLGKLKEDEYISITIRGTITGQALPMNGICKMGTFINLSSTDYIRL